MDITDDAGRLADPVADSPERAELRAALRALIAREAPPARIRQLDEAEEFDDHLYAKLEEGRARVDPSRFHEVRYETLIADPIVAMRAVYEGLGLGGFDEAQPALERYLAKHSDYVTNRYTVPEPMRREIERRCSAVIARYEYEK